MNKILTPDEFAIPVLKFSDHPYAPEYKAVMDAYRAAVHYATWREDDNGTWQCGGCEGEWIFDEGTPQENSVKYCPMCGAIIEAFCGWNDDDEGGAE